MTVLDRGFQVVRTAPVGCAGCNGTDMAVLPDGSGALNFFEPRGNRDEQRNAKSGFAVHILGDDGQLRHAVDEIPIERPFVPPGRAVLEVQQDEAGRLWVHIARPAADWRDHVVRTGGDANPERSGRVRYGPEAIETLIEVVDLESGRVLMSQVLDLEWGLLHLFAPGWLAEYDTESILPKYRMYRLGLVGSP